MITLTIAVLAIILLVDVIFLERKKMLWVVLSSLMLTLTLQYGAYPFLDAKGKAELLMWQLVSLPVIFLLALAICSIALLLWKFAMRRWSQPN